LTASKVLSNKIKRRLSWWKEEDGTWIDLVTLMRAFPDISPNFWKASLIGSKVGDERATVKRLPLEGKKYRTRTVILTRSLRAWLYHYNPNKQEYVDKLVNDLEKDSNAYQEYLKDISREVKLKSGLKRPRKEKVKEEKTGKITSREVFKIWG
jgi:hypothetical protein